MNTPVKTDIMESVIVKGDLAKLTPDERVRYYGAVCESVGLNPLTKPFEYITLNNKLTLYALRNCTDQLRTIHGVSVDELTEAQHEGVYVVTAKVRNRDGRTDIAKGVVAIANLKGEVLANAMMKAETKAKRRATLSLCGLGFLDETEVADVPVTHRRPPPPAPNAMLQHDPETGEVLPPAPVPREAAEQAAPFDTETDSGGAALSFEEMAREAAMRGEAVFKTFYKSRNAKERERLNAMGDELRGLMT
jgi:hypothetical protein